MAPRQKPGKSKQDYETPPEFIQAVEARWRPLDVDLACHAGNQKAPRGIVFPEQNTFEVNWAGEFENLNAWLNPEFGDIDPYAMKCAVHGPLMKRGRIFLLVPASIGSNWWAKHVHRHAMVLGLSPRIQFVGAAQGYPKDLSLCIFAPGMNGYDTWRWQGVRR